MVVQAVRVLVGGVFVLYLCYLAQPGSSLFSWHPFLMSLAFTVLMAEAVFTFTKFGLASGQLHNKKVTVHWILLLMAALAHILGAAAIYYNKEVNNKPHFTTYHGCLGLATALLLWIQMCGGVFARYPKLLSKFVSLKQLRANHSLSGSVTFALGMATVSLGLTSDWFLGNAGVWIGYTAIAFHLFMAFLVFKRHIQSLHYLSLYNLFAYSPPSCHAISNKEIGIRQDKK